MIVPLTIDIAGRRVQFSLDLDPGKYPYDRNVYAHVAAGQSYEAEIACVLMRTLQAGDTAIDVGANIGFFTLMMAALVGVEGKVVAFEPIEQTADRLVQNVAYNGAPGIVTVSRQPVWCRSEAVPFYTSADDAAGSCLWEPGLWHENQKSRDKPESRLLCATTLDLLDIKFPKVIKIDAEGAEENILRGASRILAWQDSWRIPYIIAELNPFGMQQMGGTTESLRTYMRSNGYDLFFIHKDDRMPTLVPPTVEVAFHGGCAVKNVLFSTVDDVAKAWPIALE